MLRFPVQYKYQLNLPTTVKFIVEIQMIKIRINVATNSEAELLHISISDKDLLKLELIFEYQFFFFFKLLSRSIFEHCILTKYRFLVL